MFTFFLRKKRGNCHLRLSFQVLIADFFLVLMALAWLGVGVLQVSASETDLLN